MPALHNYECRRCGEWTEHVTPMDHRPKTFRCSCGGRAEWRPCAPAVHTIQTFHRDIDDPFVKKHADKSGYYDPNLGRDRKTGKRTRITSEKHREQLMREAGLQPYGETDLTRDADRLKRTKPLWSGAGGPRRAANI